MRRADRDIRTGVRLRPYPGHAPQPESLPHPPRMANPEPVPYPEELRKRDEKRHARRSFARPTPDPFKTLSNHAVAVWQHVSRSVKRVWAQIAHRFRQTASKATPGSVSRIGPFRVVELATIVAIAALTAMLFVLMTFPGEDEGEVVIATVFPPSGIPDEAGTVRSVQTSTITVARPSDEAEPIVVETFKIPDARVPARCGLALTPVEHPQDYLFFNASGPEGMPTRALMILDGETVELVRLTADGPILHHGQHALQSFANQGGAVRVNVEIEFGAEEAGNVAVSEGVLRIAMPGNRVTAIPVAGYAGCTAEARAGAN